MDEWGQSNINAPGDGSDAQPFRQQPGEYGPELASGVAGYPHGSFFQYEATSSQFGAHGGEQYSEDVKPMLHRQESTISSASSNRSDQSSYFFPSAPTSLYEYDAPPTLHNPSRSGAYPAHSDEPTPHPSSAYSRPQYPPHPLYLRSSRSARKSLSTPSMSSARLAAPIELPSAESYEATGGGWDNRLVSEGGSVLEQPIDGHMHQPSMDHLPPHPLGKSHPTSSLMEVDKNGRASFLPGM
ncbi:hypothetical protein P7C70_g8997, partial [Phenoliferia sp. Uapishka_3]